MSVLRYKLKIEFAQKSVPNPINKSLNTKPIKMLKKPKTDKT